MHKGSKLSSTTAIGKVISAKIPDEATNPSLYNIVKEFMIHGPCGLANPKSPCMDKRKCTKKFRKDFTSSISINRDGFSVYKRRDDGRSVEKNGTLLDNGFVVPYNAYLLIMYQAHINVEWCSQTKAIKYLFKYINKRSDHVLATTKKNSIVNDASSDPDVEPVIDEIEHFYDFR